MPWIEAVKHMELFRMRLELFFGLAQDAPKMIWEGMELGTRIFTILIATAIVVGIISALVSFIKGNWKTKLRMLGTLLIIVLVLAAILYYALDSIEDILMPEPEDIQISGQTVQDYPQYSLARGTLDNQSVSEDWFLMDSVVSLQVTDELFLQLCDLPELPGDGAFHVTGIENWDETFLVRLERNDVKVNPAALREDQDDVSAIHEWLELCVYSEPSWSPSPWELETGEECETEDARYTVLENNGAQLLYLLEDGWQLEDGTPVVGLCLAQRTETEEICVTLRHQRYHSSGWSTVDEGISDIDPGESPELMESMLEVIEDFLDQHMILLRGLSDEERDVLLPQTLVDYPVGGVNKKDGNFSLYCKRLLSFGWYDDSPGILRLIGESPDGEEVIITIRNGGLIAREEDQAKLKAWMSAFTREKERPDKNMSDYLGCTAVAYQDGWLLHPGTVHGQNGDYENYYYLTMEPVNP